MPEIEVRRGEPADYAAIHEIYEQPRAVWGTLQIPLPSEALWKKRMEEPPEGMHHLVAVVDGKVIGQLGLTIFPSPRRKHAATLGMAVHDDWQGKGAGTALMHAAMDLADNWLNLTRLELTVFTDNEPAIALYKKFGFENLVTIKHQDIFDVDLSEADVVAVYLLPKQLASLKDHFRKLPKGARIVSHQFEIPGVQPTQSIQVESDEDGAIHDLHGRVDLVSNRDRLLQFIQVEIIHQHDVGTDRQHVA